MKKIALALAFGVLSLGAVSAQTVDKLKVKKDGKEVKAKQEFKDNKARKHEEKSPAERAERTAKRMTEDLGLNSSQTTQVRELALIKAEQMQTLKEKNGENKEAMKTEMMQIKNNFQTGLKNVLSPDQMTKFETMEAERKAKMKDKHGEHKGHGKYKTEKKTTK